MKTGAPKKKKKTFELAKIVDADDVAHYKPPHLDRHCLRPIL